MTAFPAPFLAFFGTTEIVVILFIVLLLFGAKKLPELAKGLGKSVNEFKKASTELDREEASAETKTAAKPAETTKPGQGQG
jgi:sec-independent protein translocase protein TatA